jgi:hypothetical protein
VSLCSGNVLQTITVSRKIPFDATGDFKTQKSEYLYRESCDTKGMRSPSEIKRVIEGRLKSYLSRDKTGIRREVLRLFLSIKSVTITELLAELQQRFSVTFHAIASMVGIIASRIGILRAIRNADGVNTYQLKDKYIDIVVRIVGVN